jgi:hypothetical protein
MIGITAKIGEFFTGLILALFTAGAKVLVIGVIVLALIVAALLGLQYVLGRRDRDRSG